MTYYNSSDAASDCSALTVLHAPDRRLTKAFAKDATGAVVKNSHDGAATFHTYQARFVGLDGFAERLRQLQGQPERFAGAAILFGTLPFDAGLPVTPGRLSGLPVFVAQGDADTVIPVELQRHTWSYLHEESGADLTAVRHSGGHSLDPGTLGALNTWIQQLCRLDRVDISV